MLFFSFPPSSLKEKTKKICVFGIEWIGLFDFLHMWRRGVKRGEEVCSGKRGMENPSPSIKRGENWWGLFFEWCFFSGGG